MHYTDVVQGRNLKNEWKFSENNEKSHKQVRSMASGFITIINLPDRDGAIITGARHLLRLITKIDVMNLLPMMIEHGELFAGFSSEQTNSEIPAGECDDFAVVGSTSQRGSAGIGHVDWAKSGRWLEFHLVEI